MRVLCVVAGAILFAAFGCGQLKDYLKISRDTGVSGEYVAVLGRWGAAHRSPIQNRGGPMIP